MSSYFLWSTLATFVMLLPVPPMGKVGRDRDEIFTDLFGTVMLSLCFGWGLWAPLIIYWIMVAKDKIRT